jgi:ATP-dependent phosphoenolpyruvate carboxykinase
MHNPKARRGLIMLNVALLVMLAAVTLAPSSHAQRGGGRARGEYTMVSGKVTGSSSHVVYVVDSSNQDFVAVRWNESSKSLDALGYRDLKEDANQSPGR